MNKICLNFYKTSDFVSSPVDCVAYETYCAPGPCCCLVTPHVSSSLSRSHTCPEPGPDNGKVDGVKSDGDLVTCLETEEGGAARRGTATECLLPWESVLVLVRITSELDGVEL